jgi:hypothetical protein
LVEGNVERLKDIDLWNREDERERNSCRSADGEYRVKPGSKLRVPGSGH